MSIKTDGWPLHEEDELAAVKKVLNSGCTNYWTGSEGREFEKEFATYIGTPYAIALMNGTVALEAALFALDIGPGDEVITPSRTFIASASCVVMRGAKPVIADVDLISQCITVETIKPCLTAKTKAIIVVHLAGWPADMPAIMAFAEEHNLKVIEDCAQAHGASINNRRVGSWGHVGAFSFCQDKIMTTGGEGGMITTHDKNLWEKIWAYKDHGKSFQKVYRQQHPPGFRWVHDSFGTNWRMTEMQAAIGRVQLKKLPSWLATRRKYAAILNQHFQKLPALAVSLPTYNLEHAYYKYYVFIRSKHLKPDWNRDRIMSAIVAQGIPCFSGICSEIYLEQAFIKNHYEPSAIKQNARQLGETSLMFLLHPTLTENEIKRFANGAREVLHNATMDLSIIS